MPLAEVEAVVTLRRIAGTRAPIRVVALCVARDVLVIAGRRIALVEVSPPRRRVRTLERAQLALLVLVVAEWQDCSELVNAVEQLRLGDNRQQVRLVSEALCVNLINVLRA